MKIKARGNGGWAVPGGMPPKLRPGTGLKRPRSFLSMHGGPAISGKVSVTYNPALDLAIAGRSTVNAHRDTSIHAGKR